MILTLCLRLNHKIKILFQTDKNQRYLKNYSKKFNKNEQIIKIQVDNNTLSKFPFSLIISITRPNPEPEVSLQQQQKLLWIFLYKQYHKN